MKNRALRICAIVFALYLVLGVAFYFIAGESLRSTQSSTSAVSSSGPLAELTVGTTLKQKFVCEYDQLDGVSLLVGTYGRTNEDTLVIKLYEGDATEPVATVMMATKPLSNDSFANVTFPTPIENAKNKTYTLTIQSRHGQIGNAVSFYYGNTVDSGRFSVNADIDESNALYISDGITDKIFQDKDAYGQLCMKITGTDYHAFGTYYWLIFAGSVLLFALFLLYQLIRKKKGKSTVTLSVIGSLTRYSFLIRQLVSRDFKSKYKRSVLGMLWSFLNPLLTMSIQYVVFSTIFRTSIPNFVIYLLSGIICFNFFNEATGMCLMSIVGNATLINKVYMPKYIYPFSRTLSSCINLGLSLVPLFIMMLITGTPLTLSALLLPFPLLCLFLLSYGVGLLLATMMVFFRDTQFLWNIFAMLLNYLTPIFYPASIIPEKFMPFYRLNPLYHVITFVRSILIDGISPDPMAYLWCLVLCGIPFLVGMLAFRRNEHKFVLNI